MTTVFCKASSRLIGIFCVLGILTACTPEKGPSNASELTGLENVDALFQPKNISDFNLQGTKKIVLTYDDGPTPRVTRAVLDVLRRYNIKATFFILGSKVESTQDILSIMRADGHTIANHSYSHANLSSALYANVHRLLHEVATSHDQIARVMDPSKPLYFRAPYGAWTASHAARLNQIPRIRDYIGPVYWDVGGSLFPNLNDGRSRRRPQTKSEITSGADWDCWSSSSRQGHTSVPVDVCAEGYYKEISRKQGGVVLLHDVDIRTAQLSALLIPRLLAQGYEFVNLEDLRTLEKYR